MHDRPPHWPPADTVVDATGLDCPEPVLRVRQALRTAPSGFLVEVRCTDPHAELDFEAFCARGGHELERSATTSDGFWFQLRKGR